MTRVWVTRDEPPGGPLGRALKQAGLSPVHEPVVRREMHLKAKGAHLMNHAADWLVLTSAFALECLPPGDAKQCRVAAVGSATAAAARARGLNVQLVGTGGVQELLKIMQRHIQRGVILYPRSELAPEPEPWSDVEIRSPVVYRTVPRSYDASVIENVDVAAVTSASAVQALGPVALPLACLGPSVAAAAEAIGLTPWLIAPEPSFRSLARAIAARTR